MERGLRVPGILSGACCALACLPAAAGAQTPGLPPTPIPSDPLASAPSFEGATAAARPIEDIREPPPHPFMAPNGRSNIHADAYQTDSYRVSGPLGDGTEVSALFARECGSVTFDSQGRIVTVCVGLDRPVLALLHPTSLTVLAALDLPPRNTQSGSNPLTDFSGGGYFYLDHRDHAIVATNDRRVLDVGIGAGPAFTVARAYDLASAVGPREGIISVLPDWSGRLWFVTRGGLVGTIDRGSGAVHTVQLAGEGISNSFAVDETGGVFIVSDRALYRFDAGPGGEPLATWRRAYPNSGVHKPGQSDAGSGTTPTLMGRKWVTITDNADPMNIRVYRRGKRLRKTKRGRAPKRAVCAAPVFARGASATDQSLIVAGGAIIAENNYGYSGIAAVQLGATTQPGLARVDVRKAKKRKDGKKHGRRKLVCKRIWTSAERAPSVVPKLSLANGLVYTYTKPAGTGSEDPWYLTALDFRTGATVWRRLGGGGLAFNNNYAPVTLGPDGTAYVGALLGLVAFR
ncbi:MAG TPA: hypothetical protein VHH72_02595 [Solirubrobacterales bacterium]|jgi:hypothetical protein|nr:hypothetical protein [Solirubrobacterales bacterium]